MSLKIEREKFLQEKLAMRLGKKLNNIKEVLTKSLGPKKWLMTIGTVSALSIPLMTVVACNTEDNIEDYFEKYEGEVDSYSIDQITKLRTSMAGATTITTPYFVRVLQLYNEEGEKLGNSIESNWSESKLIEWIEKYEASKKLELSLVTTDELNEVYESHPQMKL